MAKTLKPRGELGKVNVVPLKALGCGNEGLGSYHLWSNH